MNYMNCPPHSASASTEGVQHTDFHCCSDCLYVQDKTRLDFGVLVVELRGVVAPIFDARASPQLARSLRVARNIRRITQLDSWSIWIQDSATQ